MATIVRLVVCISGTRVRYSDRTSGQDMMQHRTQVVHSTSATDLQEGTISRFETYPARPLRKQRPTRAGGHLHGISVGLPTVCDPSASAGVRGGVRRLVGRAQGGSMARGRRIRRAILRRTKVRHGGVVPQGGGLWGWGSLRCGRALGGRGRSRHRRPRGAVGGSVLMLRRGFGRRGRLRRSPGPRSGPIAGRRRGTVLVPLPRPAGVPTGVPVRVRTRLTPPRLPSPVPLG
mmetsp:Transcript_2157/g.3994  ORF Transcript_2157/g.3994 Transcript_2157/m.3994 type:complete len:232 (-) Transcript_2157:11-706(-)